MTKETIKKIVDETKTSGNFENIFDLDEAVFRYFREQEQKVYELESFIEFQYEGLKLKDSNIEAINMLLEIRSKIKELNLSS